jgi:tetratricopeptide (TPR) repeat protein
MTTFGWKRKSKRFENVPAIFNQEGEEGGEGQEEVPEGVDWLSAAKRRRAVLLEDNQAKSRRLQHEGAVLAENQRYWEAMKYWDEAIELTPGSAVLYEMKSQVSSCTHEGGGPSQVET